MREWRSDDGSVVLYCADCREVAPTLDPVETCITDPPYGLEFMGKGWDHGVPATETWERIAVALLPGANLLAFGGTRMWHRLAVAIEDAGFELRDTLMWLYGQGFPKSLDISKAAATDDAKLWEGWGTALKPSWEPILVAMSPLDGTFAVNAIEHGVAGFNIDGVRVRLSECEPYEGRWPPNAILDEETAVMLDEQSGILVSGGSQMSRGRRETPGKVVYGAGMGGDASVGYYDRGGASRFFYCSKATKYDRTAGGDIDNKHPTVKPIDLMRWLCRLTATPTKGTVLDPFMGTGSTGVAAVLEGRGFIGIEREEESFEVAIERIRAAGIYPGEESKSEEQEFTKKGQGKLF